MDIFNKLVKKTQKSDRESELEIEVDNLRQKLEALKQTHEFSVKMIEDSKKADNNLLTSYNRLKSQFQELAKTLTIKKSTEFESLLKQQEEISRKKDELDRREAKIRDAEKELDDKIFVLQEIHSGKSVQNIVLENREIHQKLQQNLEIIENLKRQKNEIEEKNAETLETLKNEEKNSKNLENQLKKSEEALEKLLKKSKQTKRRVTRVKSSFQVLTSELHQLKDLKIQLESTSCLILSEFSKEFKKIQSKSQEKEKNLPQEEMKKAEPLKKQAEESKIMEPSDRKKMIPSSFLKKKSIPSKVEDLDLEKELGNPFH